jgi:hypothetical protein
VRHLTHGVSVWLCPTHGSDGYLRRGDGAEFARRLAQVWAAAGALTRRRAAALLTHMRQVRRGGSTGELPGSYSWRKLRTEAERRFSAGEDPRTVIEELRRRHDRDVARPPSVRTMRRWFTQARSLPAPARPATRPSRTPSRRQPLPVNMLPPEFLKRLLPRVPPALAWDP